MTVPAARNCIASCDEATRRRLLAAYQAGVKPKDLSGRFGMSADTIRDLLHLLGVPHRQRRTSHVRS